MKNLLKSIIAAMLVAVIAISGISTETAQAASNPVIKVTYNKKTVKFTLTDTGVKEVKYKSLKKKWGKPSETSKSDGLVSYTWKKGDTNILYADMDNGWTNYSINIYDKNAALCGIKVGMKAEKAEKILEKLGVEIERESNNIFAKYADGRCNVTVGLEKGKVIQINAVLYIDLSDFE